MSNLRGGGKLGLIGLHRRAHGVDLARSRWRLPEGRVAGDGHKTPEYQPGAAPITLRHHTHVLDGELERARGQLDRFLAQRAPSRIQRSFGPPDGRPSI
jgi:hypothetical protein